jgi:acyl-CoA thioester hydrolase
VVDYVRPIRLTDAPLVVDTWVCELRAASFTVAYELRTDAGVHARATTVLTPFVFETGRPRRLTAYERARLETTSDEPPFADARRERPAAWREDAYRRPIQVRFSDVDLLGHVNNVRYFDYVHEAQVEVMTGVFQEARISGTVDMVVARSEMDHVGQMNVRPEAYDVWSRVAAVGGTSVTFESEIRDGERVMARSRVVEVNVDEDGHPLAHHARHLELFEQRIG